MIERVPELKKDLTELAAILNQFKSEAVQLRLIELLFDAVPEGETGSDSNAATPRRRSKKRPPKRTEKALLKAAGESGVKKTPKKAASGHGATATLVNLLDGEFFKTHKTIGDIIAHAKNNMARSFKANEFSGKLARLVRSGELTRKKNADGQYEYKKP